MSRQQEARLVFEQELQRKAAEEEESRKRAKEQEAAERDTAEEELAWWRALEEEANRKALEDEYKRKASREQELNTTAKDSEHEYKQKSAPALVNRDANEEHEETPTFQVGDRVEYWSKTGGQWIDASVLHLSRHGTYDLDIKRGAKPASIRHKLNMGQITLEFDGADMGTHYLTLSAGEMVCLKRDYGNGWAKGQVMRAGSWAQCIFPLSSWQAAK